MSWQTCECGSDMAVTKAERLQGQWFDVTRCAGCSIAIGVETVRDAHRLVAAVRQENRERDWQRNAEEWDSAVELN